jgi:hypothetical protein
MPRVDARVGKLETASGANYPRVVVFAVDGESSTDCLRRHGHEPDAADVRYIVVAWGPDDQQL